jgi:hypothetical protein
LACNCFQAASISESLRTGTKVASAPTEQLHERFLSRRCGPEAKATAEKKAKEEKLAALMPPADKSDQPAAVDLPRSLQAELRRVGCNTGAVDGNWTAASQKALDLFNKNAGTKLDVKMASVDALDAVKSKSARICPLVCDHGSRADGDRCSKITCRAGYEVGDDNTCEKIEVKKPTAKREEPKRERPERAKADAAPAKPQASGQIICTQQGCRPAGKGCHLEIHSGGVLTSSSQAGSGQQEVCN